MKNSHIDDLNRVLTNTLEYCEVVKELANAGYDSETAKKLEKFAKIRKGQSEDLISIIPKEGGDIESTGRTTDQEVISWLGRPLPVATDMIALLDFLIKAEKKSLEDYKIILDHVLLKSESEKIIKKHKREGETTLHYLETARETVARSK